MPRILITGASGFLGKYLVSSLKNQAELITLGRSESNTIRCDLSVTIPELPYTDFVIHAAGKAHQIPKTSNQINEFYRVNYQATVNLTKSLEQSRIPEALVYISTVAVYGVDEGEMVSEEHPLNGDSPYARSKIQAEEFLTEWCYKNQVKLSILRLPLVVGSNAPGNLGAIVKWMRRKMYVGIGSGTARKSMVLAEDVARAIPQIFTHQGIFNLTDGYHPSLRELENTLAKAENCSPPKRLPVWLLSGVAKVGDVMGSKFPIDSFKLRKLTNSLTFSDVRAREQLGWQPRSVIDYLNRMK